MSSTPHSKHVSTEGREKVSTARHPEKDNGMHMRYHIALPDIKSCLCIENIPCIYGQSMAFMSQNMLAVSNTGYANSP